jgi:drug/metabolite transporter (DMT)-like permease
MLMGTSMVLWVAVDVFAAGLLRASPIPQVVWLRYLFHIGLMVAVLGPTAGLSFVRTSRPTLHLFRSLLMLVMPLSFWLGREWGSVPDVMGVFSLAPAVVVIGVPLILVGRSRRALFAAILGWLGTIVIYSPSFDSWLSILAGLAMAISLGTYILLTAVLDRTEGVLTNLFWSAVAVFAVLTLALPLYWQPISLHGVVTAMIVAIGGWVTLAAMDLALRRWPPTAIASLLLIQPVLDVFVRAALHGHIPATHDSVGLLILLTAIGIGVGAGVVPANTVPEPVARR